MRNQTLASLAARHGMDLSGLLSVRNDRPNPATEIPSDFVMPETAEQFENLLGDPGRMRAVLGTPHLFAQVVQGYAQHVYKDRQDLATQVRELAQREITSWLREHDAEGTVRPDLNPMASIPAQRGGIYNPRAMGAAIDSEFSNSAEYFRGIWHNTSRDASLQARITRIRNAFSSTVPSEGGFLIPENLRAELLRVALETSLVRQRARVIPMESLRVPFPAIDSTSNASSVYGGIIGYWTEEAAELTESQGRFRRVVLDSKKLTAYTEVPNELISDSAISFQAFIDMIFPEALSFYEDDAFVNGNGAGMPLGFLNSANTALISVTKEAGQAADTILWANIIKMYARMLPSSLSRAVWVASIDTFPELATMAVNVGVGGGPIWITDGTAGAPMSILGRPVLFTEKAQVLGDAGDISLVDLGFYLVGDRQVMSATSSPHYKFQNDVTAYRIIERVDGRPWLSSPITPKNGGATLSPFVQLEARA